MLAPYGATNQIESLKIIADANIEIAKIKDIAIRGVNESGSCVNAKNSYKKVDDLLEAIRDALRAAGVEEKVGFCIDCGAPKFCVKPKDNAII